MHTGVGIIGTFFVGWKQITNEILNLGLDKNLVSNDYMFYNIGAGWVNSQFPGSWMIRPVVNYDEPLVNALSHSENIECSIYPNPCSDYITVGFQDHQQRIISIFDMSGRKVKTKTLSERIINIDIKDLPEGIYFIEIFNGSRRVVKKIIILA